MRVPFGFGSFHRKGAHREHSRQHCVFLLRFRFRRSTRRGVGDAPRCCRLSCRPRQRCRRPRRDCRHRAPLHTTPVLVDRLRRCCRVPSVACMLECLRVRGAHRGGGFVGCVARVRGRCARLEHTTGSNIAADRSVCRRAREGAQRARETSNVCDAIMRDAV